MDASSADGLVETAYSELVRAGFDFEIVNETVNGTVSDDTNDPGRRKLFHIIRDGRPSRYTGHISGTALFGGGRLALNQQINESPTTVVAFGHHTNRRMMIFSMDSFNRSASECTCARTRRWRCRHWRSRCRAPGGSCRRNVRGCRYTRGYYWTCAMTRDSTLPTASDFQEIFPRESEPFADFWASNYRVPIRTCYDERCGCVRTDTWSNRVHPRYSHRLYLGRLYGAGERLSIESKGT